ncbi:MAG: hypothetical protein H7259_08180 [Cytophagales bacterium]|nr:hypothetical protein [Cytophaga sp.]
MKRFLRVFFILCFFSQSFLVWSQDIEKIAKAKPVKVSGGIGTDQVFYKASGIDPRRNAPYQYYYNGNLNITLFGELQLPVSFSYSNQRFNYTQPYNQQQFNQFGISPKYRWITAHAGWRSMSFSPYSLNGHTFLGGGVELRPGNFTIAAMYGRLLKAVEYDSTAVSAGNKPAYRRVAMALNGKYESNGNQYGFTFLRSIDDVQSLSVPLDSIAVTPEENLVWSASLRQKLNSKLTVEGEYANSVITLDSRYPSDAGQQKTIGLIKENSTTVSYHAYKAKGTYQIGKARIGAGYERIDPGYRTHGSYYFNSDLESITALFSSPFFKNKVNLSLDAGTQRNNLDKSKISTMKRLVGNVNVSYQVNKKINLSGNYSNFQTVTNMRTQFNTINSINPYQNLDTLNYMQVVQSASLVTNYAISNSEKLQQNFNLNLSAQKSGEEQGDKKLPTGTVFYNANTSYVHGFVPQALSFTLAFNGNWNQLSTGDNKTYGPTLGVSKGLFKKLLKMSLMYSWNTTISNNVSTGSIGNLRFNNTLTIKKKHNFTLSFVWLNRHIITTTSQGVPAFNENTMRFSYNYRF